MLSPEPCSLHVFAELVHLQSKAEAFCSGLIRHAISLLVWCRIESEADRVDAVARDLDIWVPHDQVEARISAAVAAGGHLVTDEHASAWWVLADAEGNEACIGTRQGHD